MKGGISEIGLSVRPLQVMLLIKIRILSVYTLSIWVTVASYKQSYLL